jgi:serine/threonine-protein kinase HipA
MKFDKVSSNGDHGLEDVPEYTLIEYAYYKMALDAGIQMNECRIYSNAGENHFMTKRFDRVEGKKIHMQSLGAMAHISYKEPRLCSYEMAAAYMREMKLPMMDIEQFYSRMVFNCIAVNQDDHVKNISFLMDRNGKWRLSPAYDITYSYDITNKWLSAHQMTVNGKKSDINLIDLLEVGEKMGLKKKKCTDIISKISLVVADFERYANEANIREKTYTGIKEILNQNKVEL